MTRLKIFIAGHNGMVGSSLVRLLKNQESEIITKDRNKLDLLNQQDVHNFFKDKKIDQVYLAAAKVGGIYANNTYPAEFIYQNLMIQNNIIHNSFLNGVKKLLFLGSSCIYPRNANQPIKEEELLSGKLEPTNEPYAVAKIAGVKMCESYNRQYGKTHEIDYRCIMPTNLYGPEDSYNDKDSHVSVDLTKMCKIRAINFNEADLLTCFSNDYGYENWVQKALSFYADKGDLLISISSSGESKNIINGAKFAKKHGCKLVTLTGFSKNNKVKKIGDINLWLNSKNYNLIEMTHHIWLLLIVDFIAKSKF